MTTLLNSQSTIEKLESQRIIDTKRFETALSKFQEALLGINPHMLNFGLALVTLTGTKSFSTLRIKNNRWTYQADFHARPS